MKQYIGIIPFVSNLLLLCSKFVGVNTDVIIKSYHKKLSAIWFEFLNWNFNYSNLNHFEIFNWFFSNSKVEEIGNNPSYNDKEETSLVVSSLQKKLEDAQSLIKQSNLLSSGK